jgi:branched-chain amino acid transport system permease protein
VNRRALLTFLAVGVALTFLPTLRGVIDFPLFYLVFLYMVFFWITQASSWNILTGYTGYFSFGQAAFFGTGVYTSAILASGHGVNFFLTIPLAGLVAGGFAGILGFVAFRLRSLRGEVFALLTLAITLVLAAVARVSTFIDGGQGRAVRVPEYPAFLGEYIPFIYRMGLWMALFAVMVSYAIYHSKFGRGLFAIHDDEDVAEALGTPTFRYKMIVLGLNGFIAGASGGLHSLQISYVTVEETFSFIVPVFVILMSVLGGRQHWVGPIIGATIIYTLQDRLAGAGFEAVSQILLGAVLIIVILFVPEGLYSRLRIRLYPAAAVFAVALLALQVADVGRSLVSRFAVAMVIMLPLLFLPERWVPGTRHPTRATAPPLEAPPAATATDEQDERVGT